MDKLKCEICLKEYEQAIVFSYELNKIACIPCIRTHNQPERLNPEDKNWFGMKAEIKQDGLCYFEDGTVIDPSQPIDVCDSPNSGNK